MSALSLATSFLSPVLFAVLGLSLASGRAMAVGPAVVELFTSEGCSSCPPAEVILGSIAQRPDVVTLAFHVTYWDSSAWRDRFGRRDATLRQAQYVDSLRLSSAYTPQVVVNGRINVLGSDAQAIERMMARLERPAALSVALEGTTATVTLPSLPTECPCTLELVSTRAVADTAVAGGENGGRKLREYSIVRSFEAVGAWDGMATTRQLSRSRIPTDASTVVVLATRQRDRGIVAVGRVSTP
jgi:hypothetical protein